ncbi:hypothetical protein [Streptomyces sp. RG80]|uniref:hypothetical protein n=1 Tax=Streptomyces sp. RG80 TaxID=3157340 RepID=UPI00338F9E54
MAALASSGPPKLPKLSDGQVAVLEQELAPGPATHGWEVQRWTLARIRELIARKFRSGLLVGGGVAADAPARLVLAVVGPPGT